MARPNSQNRMNGPQKAATALLAMGEEASALILKKLSTDEIKALSTHMSYIEGVRKETSDELLQEFTMLFKGEGGINVAGDQFIRNLLPSVMKSEQVEEVLSKIEEDRHRIPFKHLRDVDPRMLAGFIKGEHPQTMAIIISHLGHDKAGQVIGHLPEQLQFELITRIANLEMVSPDLIREVDEVLQKELSAIGTVGQGMGGVNVVAEILNRCDHKTGESILRFLEETDAELAEKVRKMMFVFEDLLQTNDMGIRELLKEIKSEVLSLALKTASEDLKAKVFKNLGQRAAQMLEEEISMMAPARLSEVEAAQQEILTAARKLEKEGKLFLASKEGGDSFV